MTEPAIAIADDGAGAAVVLIHGFGCDGTLWDPIVERLRGVARLIRPDLRGLGRSREVPGPFTMSQAADDVAAALDARGIARATIVGHSMSGMVALAFARRHPKRLAAWSLVDSRVDPDTPDQERNRETLAERTVREGAQALVDAYLPKFFAPATYRERPELVERARRMLAANDPVRAAAVLRESVRRDDPLPILSALCVPVAIVMGSADAFLTVPAQRRIADAAPAGELVVIEGAGHMPMWEDPDALAEAIASLVERAAADEDSTVRDRSQRRY